MQTDTPAVKQDLSAQQVPADNGQKPVFGLPPEENPDTQPIIDESGSDADPADTQSRENKYIPYSRFREVIDERNKLREQLAGYESNPGQDYNNPNGSPDPLTDDEINMLWAQNPSYAAKVMFAQTISEFFENNRRKNESVAIALEQYPEIADSNHELSITARNIIQKEMPHLRTTPDGIRIATEIAAARYYKNQYENILKSRSNQLKNLEANRLAGLKGAFMEHSAPSLPKSYHDCLSADEQRIAAMMGVPVESYVEQKCKSNKLGGKNL